MTKLGICVTRVGVGFKLGRVLVRSGLLSVQARIIPAGGGSPRDHGVRNEARSGQPVSRSRSFCILRCVCFTLLLRR